MKQLFFLLLLISYSLNGIAQNQLTLKEQAAILYMREEEKLARDVYDSMFAKYDVNPFGNIRKSEQIHMDKVKGLIETYKLTDPVEFKKDTHGLFTNRLLQKYYDDLISSGSLSFTDALKVGAKIEELDIHDLNEHIKQTQNQEIISVFNYLKIASGNHLRAFVRRLKMQNIAYNPSILSKEEFEAIIVE